jgi:cell wall-associated NlpC family hydrolase
MGLHPNGPDTGQDCAVEAPETTLLTQTGSTLDVLAEDTATEGDGKTVSVIPTPIGDAVPMTRRARREAEAAAAARAVPAARAAVETPAVIHSDAIAAAAAIEAAPHSTVVTGSQSRTALGVNRVVAPARPVVAPRRAQSTVAKKRRFLPIAVVTIIAGIFGTTSLAAFANPAPQSVQNQAASTSNIATQSLSVSDAAALADTSRDGYTATSPQVLANQKAAAASAAATAAAVAAARAKTAATYASYSGPTAADYVANPKYPSFSLAQVAAVGQQYIGTPYIYGGATPAGFDCSGFVMYVYAQFGISLAHSVPLQDAAGTTISEADAQPGDVVIFNTEAHDGIYMGNGMIMDAPKPGGFVSIRPIWTSAYHIVRFGIK